MTDTKVTPGLDPGVSAGGQVKPGHSVSVRP
jgi:hypothetical protein